MRTPGPLLRPALALAVAAAVPVLAGCASGEGEPLPVSVRSGGPPPSDSPPPLGAETRLRIPPDDQHTDLHTGDRLVVTLAGGATASRADITSPDGRTVLVETGDDGTTYHFFALRAGDSQIRWSRCPRTASCAPFATLRVTVAG